MIDLTIISDDLLGSLQPETLRIVYYQEKAQEWYSQIVKKCEQCGGEGLLTDPTVRLKLGRPTDDIRGFLSEISAERKECSCQKVFRRALSYIEANLPEDLWLVNRKIIEDKKVIDMINNRRVSLKNIIDHYMGNLEEACQKGIGFIFYGPVGTGKTLFGCKVLVNAIRKGYSGHYTFFYDFIEMLKNFDDHFIYEVIAEIMEVDFLFVDEIGKEYKTSQFVLTNFEKLLKERRSRSKPTLFATNLDSKTFADVYGPSIHSVITTSNIPLSFQSLPDMRRKKYLPKVKKFFESI